MDVGGGQNGRIRCTDIFFHLIFILNKSLKLWYECNASAMVLESETAKAVWKPGK